MLERKEQCLMMWLDLRKEAWSPGEFPPVRSHVYANIVLQLIWTPGYEKGEGREDTGRERKVRKARNKV